MQARQKKVDGLDILPSLEPLYTNALVEHGLRLMNVYRGVCEKLSHSLIFIKRILLVGKGGKIPFIVSKLALNYAGLMWKLKLRWTNVTFATLSTFQSYISYDGSVCTHVFTDT